MLLFLDVISPLPEFCVIDDNKIILQEKIIQNETDRLSDNIIQSYVAIDKRLNLTQNLKKISTTIGPGSYTSLRVGSAFISGLMTSRKIPYYPLSIADILYFSTKKTSKKNLGVFITSSNNQQFLCYKNKDNIMEYNKIENNKLEQIQFSFFDEFYKNYNNLIFKKNIIIKPIYISNNQILN